MRLDLLTKSAFVILICSVVACSSKDSAKKSNTEYLTQAAWKFES